MTRPHHSPRCAIFNDPPTLRDPFDCDCGATPPLNHSTATPTNEQVLDIVRHTLEIVNRDITPPTAWKINDQPATISQVAAAIAVGYQLEHS